MVIDKLQLSGSELKSNDALGGVTMRSENEDVEITAGRQVSMHGKSVNVFERVLTQATRSWHVVAAMHDHTRCCACRPVRIVIVFRNVVGFTRDL